MSLIIVCAVRDRVSVCWHDGAQSECSRLLPGVFAMYRNPNGQSLMNSLTGYPLSPGGKKPSFLQRMKSNFGFSLQY